MDSNGQVGFESSRILYFSPCWLRCPLESTIEIVASLEHRSVGKTGIDPASWRQSLSKENQPLGKRRAKTQQFEASTGSSCATHCALIVALSGRHEISSPAAVLSWSKARRGDVGLGSDIHIQRSAPSDVQLGCWRRDFSVVTLLSLIFRREVRLATD
jgi:hypothetical protein